MRESKNIPLSDYHAIEESIRYIEQNPDANYEDIVHHLNWYWKNGNLKTKWHHPKEWVLDWLKCLVGEYDYNDFCLRRNLVGCGDDIIHGTREF